MQECHDLVIVAVGECNIRSDDGICRDVAGRTRRQSVKSRLEIALDNERILSEQIRYTPRTLRRRLSSNLGLGIGSGNRRLVRSAEQRDARVEVGLGLPEIGVGVRSIDAEDDVDGLVLEGLLGLGAHVDNLDLAPKLVGKIRSNVNINADDAGRRGSLTCQRR